MNYTTNYHLPQWVKEDRIMMEDFNAAMANLESGITNAKEAAEDAKTEAVKLPYVVGSYVGTGTTGRIIAVGFRPSFIFVGTQFEYPTGGSGMDAFTGFTAGGVIPDHLKLTNEGFAVNCNPKTGFPDLNRKDFTYNYIAFR